MFKNYILLVALVCFSVMLKAQTIFINEIHYDNVDTDQNEGIELAAAAGTDLSCYELHLYNGSNSSVYEMYGLEGLVEDEGNGFGFYWLALPENGLQNGSPDGIALYNKCDQALIQFLSYEGTINAVDGPANGVMSVDIGQEEIGVAEIGTSLQLTGTGATYEDFVWSPGQTATAGSINVGQSFGEGGTDTPMLTITGADASHSEDAGEIGIPLQAVNVSEDFDIIISLGDGTATVDEDFTRSAEVIKVSAADGANQSFVTTIDIIDDEEEEGNETVIVNFELDNENVSLNKTSVTITIEDNDSPETGLPEYTIAQVSTENADGVADSLEVKCQLIGVVQGINLFDSGTLLFTIHDGTAGISIFNNSTDFEYTVTPGDEITVEGAIDQFNGLTQIAIDALTLNTSGNALQEFKEVLTLDERTESKNVILRDLMIVDENQWVGDGNSFNVDFLTSTGETIVVRIDNNSPLSNTAFADLFEIAAGSFEISGICGQFDNESPYDSGYQLFPFTIDNFNLIMPSVDPMVNITAADASHGEDAGEIEIPIQAINVDEDFDIIITIGDGTATLDEDFTRSSEVIKVFAEDGANQSFVTTIGIIDDEEEEGNETVVVNFELDNENVGLNKTSVTITIEDNDTPEAELPQYTIAEVSTENADGVADSLEVKCQLTGVVQGINLFNEGTLLFTIHDGTAGISIFNNSTDFEYTVTPGDEITVEGTIDQFNGLTQIAVDALTLNSSGNTLQAFTEVSTIDESTESEYVVLRGLMIVDESQWLGDGSSFNVDFLTLDGETIVVRIDNNTPLSTTAFADIFETAPGTFTISGIGGQFDNESPYDSRYQLFPFTRENVEQLLPGVEEISLHNIGIFPTSKNSFKIETLYPVNNIKVFKMNGKEISVSQNKNEFTLNTIVKGIYLITFEMDGQIYSSKISIN